MLLIKLAWRNLVRHYKKSLLLGSLIMIGMAVLFLANSVFLGTNEGLRKTLIGSFTGDAAICTDSNNTYSLFGNEIPIVSDYEIIPPLFSHGQIEEQIMEIPEVEAYTSIVSIPSRMTLGNIKKNVALFGIDPETYFNVCTDISILKGDIEELRNSGVFLNSVLAGFLETRLKRPLEIGELLSFTMYSGNSFRIRTVPFLGIHEYSGSTEALDLVVLADLTTVRSLADYTLGYISAEQESEASDMEDDPFDLDDLFSADTDVTEVNSEAFDLQKFEEDISETSERDSLILTDNGAWSFILVKAYEGKSGLMFNNLKKILEESQSEAELLSWRRAAGSTALILFAVQSVFYLGLGFLGLGAVLVIMNALVFSVLERAGEIGTMRSLGAAPGFIRTLFMVESLFITIGGAVLGILIGAILAIFLKVSDVQLTNSLFISLFGGSSLNPLITLNSIISHIFIALILGSLAWIYPVSLAMKIQPVSAMNKG